MSLQEQIEAADAYEALFVPAVFSRWSGVVVDAAGVGHRHHVLDVACGTGVLAREAHARVGSEGRVFGVDVNPGMLAVAERRAPTLGWRQASAESLPFADASFDAVVSQFGLMFFGNRVQALREMRRVLRPGGRLAVAVWDSLANNPAWATETMLLEKRAGPSAAEALRAPHVLGDRNLVRQLFAEAGLASAEISTQTRPAEFPSVRAMVEADLRGWLPVMGVTLTDAQVDAILEEAEHVLAPFVADDGRAVFDTSAHVITAQL